MTTKALTLYQTEERLTALLDTADVVPADQIAEFQAELVAAGEAALDKRDRCIQFLRHVEAQIEMARAEEKRIAEWRRSLESGLERFEGYVARTIEENVPEPKRGPRKLEGRVGALVLVKKPGKVIISDLDAVPAKYKRATITVPCETLNAMLNELHRRNDEESLSWIDVAGSPLLDALVSAKYDAPLTPIKAAIDAEEDVPGADVTINQYRLEVR